MWAMPARQSIVSKIMLWVLIFDAMRVCGTMRRIALGIGKFGPRPAPDASWISQARCCQGFFKDAQLLGVHALGLGAEFPGFEPSQLERDAIDLRVAPLDGLGLGVNVPALLADVRQHLRCHGGQRSGSAS